MQLLDIKKRIKSTLSDFTNQPFKSPHRDKPLRLNWANSLTTKSRRSEANYSAIQPTTNRYVITNRSKQSPSSVSKKQLLVYNKWFIHPSKRMKHTESPQKIDKSDDKYVYKQLYSDRYVDTENPFKEQIEEKKRILQKLSKNNLNHLEIFRKSQLKSKKRVPEIVEMLIRKRRIKTEM